MSTEALHEEQMRVDDDNGSQASMSINNNSSDDDEFFDPQEGDVAVNVSGESDPDNIEEMLKRKASSMLSPRHNRVGARCPVPDALPLIESGDQVRHHVFALPVYCTPCLTFSACSCTRLTCSGRCQ